MFANPNGIESLSPTVGVIPRGPTLGIRAAIRPAHGKEFDVDLVCEFKKMPHDDPKVVKGLVWERFHNSDRYRSMAVEKNRCVQLQFAGDFHMDIMPCVPHQPGWVKQGPISGDTSDSADAPRLGRQSETSSCLLRRWRSAVPVLCTSKRVEFIHAYRPHNRPLDQ